MSRGTEKLIKSVKQFADTQYKFFSTRYGQQVIDILEFPIKVVLSPFTLAFDIAGSAPRGFGIPEFISKLSHTSIFAIAALGTYDIALELGKKVICQSLGTVVLAMDGKLCGVPCAKDQGNGEKATAECVADAIADNRAELVHLPSAIDLNAPLPSKKCPPCDGTVSLIFLLLENFLNWTIFGFDPWFKHVLLVGSNALSRMQAQNTSQDLCG
ncbi:Chaperone protein DnaJ [Gossypium australe]|uniref:Chaperone protein DnaJ n=1 Tax=Gossypium australe TaxID=47621 RepID=A0A5B6VQW9_9ROSI|nr:Chaperone protein DnaJ [Gossypium australe]